MTTSRVGRSFGGLLILQLAGLIVPFVLLLPLGRDFLVAAAPSAGAIRTAVILLFANGGLTIGLSLIAMRMLRGGGDMGPLWLVAAGVIMCLTQAVDNACVLSMLAASERVAAAARPDDALQVAGEAIRIVRQWTHTVAILAIDVWIASLYLLLHRRRVGLARWRCSASPRSDCTSSGFRCEACSATAHLRAWACRWRSGILRWQAG